MAGLLYLWGSIDERVAPLIFAVRKWAREHKLVEDVRPTQKFTNFPLTLMVIFYLQSKHKILPSMSKLRQLACKYLCFN